MKANLATAALACLSIAALTVTYLIKGSAPDVLTMISTTAVGGFLGVTIPHPSGK